MMRALVIGIRSSCPPSPSEIAAPDVVSAASWSSTTGEHEVRRLMCVNVPFGSLPPPQPRVFRMIEIAGLA